MQFDKVQHSCISSHCNMTMNQRRHLQVSKNVEKYNICRLLQIGCADGELLMRLSRSPHIEFVAGFDIDQEILKKTARNVYPQGIQADLQYSRSSDQQVLVFQADALKNYRKLKEYNFQMVALVDVIQHLIPSDIPAAIENIFGYLKPKYCFISTPNKDFNYHFSNPEKLRHPDHKFQWTREQFFEFCTQTADKYDYNFEIGGIGDHIQDISKGQCTQFAVFTKNADETAINYAEKSKGIQMEEFQMQLKEIVNFKNLCWRSNIKTIMAQTLFNLLMSQKSISFQEAIQRIKSMRIGQALIKEHTQICKQMLIIYLNQERTDFQWDQEKFWRKGMQDEQQGIMMDQEEESSSWIPNTSQVDFVEEFEFEEDQDQESRVLSVSVSVAQMQPFEDLQSSENQQNEQP